MYGVNVLVLPSDPTARKDPTNPRLFCLLVRSRGTPYAGHPKGGTPTEYHRNYTGHHIPTEKIPHRTLDLSRTVAVFFQTGNSLWPRKRPCRNNCAGKRSCPVRRHGDQCPNVAVSPTTLGPSQKMANGMSGFHDPTEVSHTTLQDQEKHVLDSAGEIKPMVIDDDDGEFVWQLHRSLSLYVMFPLSSVWQLLHTRM